MMVCCIIGFVLLACAISTGNRKQISRMSKWKVNIIHQSAMVGLLLTQQLQCRTAIKPKCQGEKSRHLGHYIDRLNGINKRSTQVSWTLVCTGELFMSLITNLLCLPCVLRSRWSRDKQVTCTTKPPTSPCLTKLAIDPPYLKPSISLTRPPPLTLYGTPTNLPSSRLVNPLPPSPRTSDPDWITDRVRKQSKKKQEAWVRLMNALLQDTPCLQSQYHRLKKLTKVAAEIIKRLFSQVSLHNLHNG